MERSRKEEDGSLFSKRMSNLSSLAPQQLPPAHLLRPPLPPLSPVLRPRIPLDQIDPKLYSPSRFLAGLRWSGREKKSEG